MEFAFHQQAPDDSINPTVKGVDLASTATFTEQVNGNIPNSEGIIGLDLHRACAEGKLEEVQAVLSRSLDALESMGKEEMRLNSRII